MAYITEAELTAEGITLVAGDPRGLIPRAQAQVERVTGRIFEPRAMTLTVNGSGTSWLHFGNPIIAITSIAEDGTLVDADGYIIHNRHLSGVTSPDDRIDPTVELYADAFEPGERSVWSEGVGNYEITGIFGYTDWDGHSDLILPYKTQPATLHNFSVGDVVTGVTSGATGTIMADADAGTTGTLTLSGVTGHFIDSETITDTHVGTAKANITTYWQGVTPRAIKVATMLYVKKFMLLVGSPLFSAAYLRDAEEGDTKALPYTITGDRMIDEILSDFMRPATAEFV